MPFPVHHPSLPYDTLSPSTKYSGDSHKGWLLQLVDIMVGWACTVPTRKRADRRGSVQSIIACTERAALHRAIPLPRPFNPSLSQPEYRPPSPLHPSSFAGPNPSPSPSNVPSRFLQPPPPGHRRHHHPFAPVVITSIHFTLKAAGVVPLRCPETSPARVAFSLRIATRPPSAHPPTITSSPGSTLFQIRAITGGDDSSDASELGSSSLFLSLTERRFSPRSENIDDFAGRWSSPPFDG